MRENGSGRGKARLAGFHFSDFEGSGFGIDDCSRRRAFLGPYHHRSWSKPSAVSLLQGLSAYHNAFYSGEYAAGAVSKSDCHRRASRRMACGSFIGIADHVSLTWIFCHTVSGVLGRAKLKGHIFCDNIVENRDKGNQVQYGWLYRQCGAVPRGEGAENDTACGGQRRFKDRGNFSVHEADELQKDFSE